MINIKNFVGKVDGKTLAHYKNKVDHNLLTTQDRINNVKDILEVEESNNLEWSSNFWCSAFTEGCCSTSISTNDALYSETDVAIFLENMASYILSADEKPKAEKIKIYDSYSEFDRMRKEKEKLEKLGSINGEEFLMYRENKNFKKEKKQKVTSNDIEASQLLKDYEEARLDYLRMYKTELVGLNLTRAEKIKKNLVKKHLGMFKVDLIDAKNSIEQPIVWKNPLPDNNEINWDEVDFLNKAHVKELIRLQPNNAPSSLKYILLDFNNILSKVGLSEKQKIVLELWRSGKNQTEIGSMLNVTQQMIYKQIDVISSKIVAAAEEEIEDWYYLNIAKGTYKKCPKCGKVQLASRFNNKNKCKEC